MSKRRLQCLLLSFVLGPALACNDRSGVPMAGPTSPLVPTPAISTGANATIRQISIGDVVTAAVRSGDPYCVFDGDDLTAPCERYSVAVSQAGTVVIRATWSNAAHFLQIVFPWSNHRGGINCCSSPHVERIAVVPGRTYEFQLWFIGATYGPGGHTPSEAEQRFELATTFEPN